MMATVSSGGASMIARKARLVAVCGSIAIAALAASFPFVAQAQTGGDSLALVAESPDSGVLAAKVKGCWFGTTNDDTYGAGTLQLRIRQSNKGQSIPKGASRFHYLWPSGPFAYGPMTGSVNGDALAIHGLALTCATDIAGIVNPAGNEITGTYSFTGTVCEKDGFIGGTFDVMLTASANCKVMP